jgi:hypothetical protein
MITVRVKGQAVKTYVFAESTVHARLLAQYTYGIDSLVSSPQRIGSKVQSFALNDDTIKPITPLSPEKARIQALKKNIDLSKQQLQRERERQRMKAGNKSPSANMGPPPIM